MRFAPVSLLFTKLSIVTKSVGLETLETEIRETKTRESILPADAVGHEARDVHPNAGRVAPTVECRLRKKETKTYTLWHTTTTAQNTSERVARARSFSRRYS